MFRKLMELLEVISKANVSSANLILKRQSDSILFVMMVNNYSTFSEETISCTEMHFFKGI